MAIQREFTEEQLAKIRQLEGEKVRWPAYVALVFAIVFFSGFLTGKEGILGIFDYSNLMGKWGLNFRGEGGNGARDGFAYVMTIWPNVTVALAFMNVIEGKGGLRAAQKLMNPILRPVLGIPGWCGLSLITGWACSTDGGTALTIDLVDNELINERELAIFSCWSFVASGSIGSTLSLTGVFAPYLLADGVPIFFLFAMYAILKIMATNLMRIYVNVIEKPDKAKKGEA